MNSPFILFSDHIRDVPPVHLVGGKCSQLARISQVNKLVPMWFCITTEAFKSFLSANKIFLPLCELHNDEIIATRQQILDSPFPNQLREDINKAIDRILLHSASKALAVRSSATVEDAPVAAYAGQFDTFLGLSRSEVVLQKIKQCWASLFSNRAIKYRSWQTQKDHLAMAVLVQDFIPADVSGVTFTVNPTTRKKNELVIEASWGLGEMVVGGKVVPDHFVLEVMEATQDFNIIASRIGSKRRYLEWDAEKQHLREIATPSDLQRAFTLDKSQVLELARLGLSLQVYFGCPQDIEWAVSRGLIYLLQSRPITTI